ncbi:zf-RING_2 domain-containing protein [Cephalotus follicularis]|uniref:Zf-RING_2 domain-containing protein n=1 Tax=Cephalotus follicularis TaxID=3775 RepID=A0A1Q3BG09_CEPFO|nr:zf-RING_2 domain-containing protein [Cephalotus follicularis]
MVGSKETDHDHHDHPLMNGGDDRDDDVGLESPCSGVACSICFDLVSDNGARSRAKLHCGHEFHLDCIGSAFNMKGAMQCPNCRKVEKGRWLYANGSARSLPEFSMEDLIPDEDFYDLSYPALPFRLHWCPFGELMPVGSSFEEVESPSTTYHDFRGHHTVFADHTVASSVAHSYVAYVAPIAPTNSRSSDSVDDPNFSHHWSSLSRHNENLPPNGFPAINIQYHSWGRHSPPFVVSSSHVNGAEQASVPPQTFRSPHGEPDAIITRSASRAGNSFISSAVPHHPGNGAQTHERIQLSYAFHHQQQPSHSPGMPSSMVPCIRRVDGTRGLQNVMQAAPQPDQNGGFYVCPPSSSSGQTFHEAESHLPNHCPHPIVHRETGWGSYYQNAGGSDSGNRSSSFWPRHSS